MTDDGHEKIKGRQLRDETQQKNTRLEVQAGQTCPLNASVACTVFSRRNLTRTLTPRGRVSRACDVTRSPETAPLAPASPPSWSTSSDVQEVTSMHGRACIRGPYRPIDHAGPPFRAQTRPDNSPRSPGPEVGTCPPP